MHHLSNLYPQRGQLTRESTDDMRMLIVAVMQHAILFLLIPSFDIYHLSYLYTV
jgi:hypothetical protein